MHFRSNKKNGNTVSLNDAIGYDKDGNEISLMEIIKDETVDIADTLHLKENVELLKKYLKILTPREMKMNKLKKK